MLDVLGCVACAGCRLCSWLANFNDYYDAKGAAYKTLAFHCNYNCFYYGW